MFPDSAIATSERPSGEIAKFTIGVSSIKRVATSGLILGESVDFKPPDAKPIVSTSGDDEFSVASDIDGKHFTLGLTKGVEPCAAGDVPYLCRFIGTGTDQNLSVGRKSEIKDRPIVTGQVAEPTRPIRASQRTIVWS